jgi:hypothetical protein
MRPYSPAEHNSAIPNPYTLLLLLLLLPRRLLALHDARLHGQDLADQQRTPVAEERQLQLPLPAL